MLNQIHGGILGEICWNWLEIYTLMIDEDIRRLCYGSSLLLEIEQTTLNNKCYASPFVRIVSKLCPGQLLNRLAL